jgi:hypothetical protein
MITYTLVYYEGEEREVKLNSIFSNIESVMGFISDSQLHPDYLMVTEWDGDEILVQTHASYYYND